MNIFSLWFSKFPPSLSFSLSRKKKSWVMYQVNIRYSDVQQQRQRLPGADAESLCWTLRVWLVFISRTARERLVWNFPNFLSHSNFPPIRARDTRPEGGRLVVGALPLVVWPLELAANGARPGFRAQPGKLPSVFNHRTVYILTVEPLTGHRHQKRAEHSLPTRQEIISDIF